MRTIKAGNFVSTTEIGGISSKDYFYIHKPDFLVLGNEANSNPEKVESD